MNLNDSQHIFASALHSIGCTHRDLHHFSLSEKNFENIWQKIREKESEICSYFWEKRWGKIEKNFEKFSLENHEKKLQDGNIVLKLFTDTDFPAPLRNISNIPFILYTKGNIELKNFCLWVVGSRKNTSYGKSALKKIVDEIPYSDISIISGGAYGIDSLAHSEALEKNLHTIAVFGCGIDVVYPTTNKILFEKIVASDGGLLSIFPLGAEPEMYHFPIRNEIVAGLSDAILIPEAGEKSGTLITARLALELWKEVYAIPWDIFRETSAGSNSLIHKGEAQCTLSASDIFEGFHPKLWEKITTEISKNRNEKHFESEIAKEIFYAIDDKYNTVDLLVNKTGISVEMLAMELTMLEISGDIRQSSLGEYETIF